MFMGVFNLNLDYIVPIYLASCVTAEETAKKTDKLAERES